MAGVARDTGVRCRWTGSGTAGVGGIGGIGGIGADRCTAALMLEVDPVGLVRAGGGWLAGHPLRSLISRRYLAHRWPLTRAALARLAEVDDTEPENLDHEVGSGSRMTWKRSPHCPPSRTLQNRRLAAFCAGTQHTGGTEMSSEAAPLDPATGPGASGNEAESAAPGEPAGAIEVGDRAGEITVTASVDADEVPDEVPDEDPAENASVAVEPVAAQPVASVFDQIRGGMAGYLTGRPDVSQAVCTDHDVRRINLTALRPVAAAHPFPLVFSSVSGAHLYGFPSTDSDIDLRGVYVLPAVQVVGLRHGPQTVERTWSHDGVQLDLVTYDVGKFFRLMLRRNGYVLEQLLSPWW